jgi:hypothetical protein
METATANRRPQALPHFHHDGIDYFIDFRLEEIRPVNAPWQSIPFVFLCDEEMKAQIRGIRFDHWGQCYMAGLDD